jgi:hypothetical protein
MLVSVTIDYDKARIDISNQGRMAEVGFYQDGHEFYISFDSTEGMKELAGQLFVKACEIEGKNNAIPLRGERR